MTNQQFTQQVPNQQFTQQAPQVLQTSPGTVAQASASQPGQGLQQHQSVGAEQQQMTGKGTAGLESSVAKIDKQPSQILHGSSVLHQLLVQWVH